MVEVGEDGSVDSAALAEGLNRAVADLAGLRTLVVLLQERVASKADASALADVAAGGKGDGGAGKQVRFFTRRNRLFCVSLAPLAPVLQEPDLYQTCPPSFLILMHASSPALPHPSGLGGPAQGAGRPGQAHGGR